MDKVLRYTALAMLTFLLGFIFAVKLSFLTILLMLVSVIAFFMYAKSQKWAVTKVMLSIMVFGIVIGNFYFYRNFHRFGFFDQLAWMVR